MDQQQQMNQMAPNQQQQMNQMAQIISSSKWIRWPWINNS
jgi:hypothetical protein